MKLIRKNMTHKPIAARTLIMIFGLWALIALPHGSAKGLTFCAINPTHHFNPADGRVELADRAWARLLYDRLVELNPDGTGIKPALAKSWEITEDGRAITFTLNQDVPFHAHENFRPSRPLNANDVVFTFERLSQPNNPFYRLLDEDNSHIALMLSKLQRVEAIDADKVVFRLKAPDSAFLAFLTEDYASILSAEYAEKLQRTEQYDRLFTWPVGTGGFRLVAHYPDYLINMRAFEDSWRGKPKTNNILIIPIADEAQRVVGLRASECDIIPAVTGQIAEGMGDDNSVKVLMGSSREVHGLVYNLNSHPLEKDKVRQGLNAAINRPLISKFVYANHALEGVHLLPPNSWAYDDETTGPPFSTGRARELLSLEGVLGQGVSLWIPADGLTGQVDPSLLGDIIKSGWYAAGVQVQEHYVPQKEIVQLMNNPNRPGVLVISLSGEYGDPDSYLGVALTCNSPRNITGWCNPLYDKLVEQAAIASDLAQRKELYARALALLQIEMPISVLAYPLLYYPMRTSIEGFQVHPMGIYDLSQVYAATIRDGEVQQ